MQDNEGKSAATLLLLIVGLTSTTFAPDVSFARQKNEAVAAKCGCICKDPTGFGEMLTDIRNTAGVACSAYNGRACSLDGGTRTGKTMNCQTDNSSGTKSLERVPSGATQGNLQQSPAAAGAIKGSPSGTIQRRGIEGESPTSSETKGQ
jgi:hypothetical protein